MSDSAEDSGIAHLAKIKNAYKDLQCQGLAVYKQLIQLSDKLFTTEEWSRLYELHSSFCVGPYICTRVRDHSSFFANREKYVKRYLTRRKDIETSGEKIPVRKEKKGNSAFICSTDTAT